jgi:hypothetical protein
VTRGTSAEGWHEEQATRRDLFRSFARVGALLLLAACGRASAPPTGKEPERTLPPTVAVELSPGTVVSRPAMLDLPEDAQEVVSFQVLVPDPEALPTGLALERVEWQPDPERGMKMVALSYRDASGRTDLHIQQIDLGGRRIGPTGRSTFAAARAISSPLTTLRSMRPSPWPGRRMRCPSR